MKSFELRPLHPAIGAEVVGMDSLSGLASAEIAQLRRAFDERHLLLFRGIDLSADQQVAFCKLLRPVCEPPAWISNTEEAGFHLESELLFHCDYAFRSRPMLGLSLYAIELGRGAAPTVFTSNRWAFETLPEDLWSALGEAEVVHAIDSVHGRESVRTHLCELGGDDAPHDVYPRYARPVLWTHPVLGEPMLFVLEQQASHIVGWSCDRSETVLAQVHDHQYRPDNMYTHEWAVGDFVVWDNLALQHGRPANPNTVRRSLRRVMMNTVTTEALIRGTGFHPDQRKVIAARGAAG